jgi:hypothetical protein
MYVDASSRLSVGGADVNMPQVTCTVSGDANYHIAAGGSSMVHFAGVQLTTVGNLNIGIWLVCANSSYAPVRYSVMNMGGTVIGQRYSVGGNGVIYSSGGGPNYYPGTIAGGASSGGQYI